MRFRPFPPGRPLFYGNRIAANTLWIPIRRQHRKVDDALGTDRRRRAAACAAARQSPGAANGPVKAEFRAALEPYGRWQRHARWGEVWTPANRPREWRPYTVGRWAYTDDWGWYWISDEPEAQWGWVAYHYGRWIFDDELGWCWVPGDEWSPAWVQWRRARQGFDYVGCAPLPPDDLIVEYVEEPRFWIFVRGPDFRAAEAAAPARHTGARRRWWPRTRGPAAAARASRRHRRPRRRWRRSSTRGGATARTGRR